MFEFIQLLNVVFRIKNFNSFYDVVLGHLNPKNNKNKLNVSGSTHV